MSQAQEAAVLPLEKRLAELESRLLHLENIEAVRRGIAGYCRALDANDLSAMSSLFAQKARLRIVPWHIEVIGHDAIVDFYQQFFAGPMKNYRHYTANTIIERDGQGYRAISYFHETTERGSESLIGWGTYEHVFVFEQGNWRIAEKLVTILALTPIEKGWAGPEKIVEP